MFQPHNCMNSELLLAISLRKGLLKPLEKPLRSKREVRFICVYKVAFVEFRKAS